jgi:hypothetical protein
LIITSSFPIPPSSPPLPPLSASHVDLYMSDSKHTQVSLSVGLTAYSCLCSFVLGSSVRFTKYNQVKDEDIASRFRLHHGTQPSLVNTKMSSCFISPNNLLHTHQVKNDWLIWVQLIQIFPQPSATHMRFLCQLLQRLTADN